MKVIAVGQDDEVSYQISLFGEKFLLVVIRNHRTDKMEELIFKLME